MTVKPGLTQMASANAHHRPKAEPQRSERLLEERRRAHFLRYSHIFASVVREILEAKFLEEITPHFLTPAQFHLLKMMALNGGHQVSEVAVFLGVSTPAATKSLDKLERLGFILRGPSKDDRRATLITPSAKGRRLVQEYEVLLAERLAPVLEKFGPKELDRLVRVMRRFSLSMIRREDPGDGPCLWCAAYCEENCPVSQIRGDCPCSNLCGVSK